MKSAESLLDVIFANEENLLDQVQALLAAGANPNERTRYFETPLRVSSRNGRFDVVKCLYEAGADPTHLNWTPLFHAIAYGSLSEVKDRLAQGGNLHSRDTWERTPILVAVLTGDVQKVSLLIEFGADLTDLGRANTSALEYAIQMDDARMLSFLIGQGFDFETYNDFGYTALMQAAEDGAISCVCCLLEHGADIHKKDRSQFSQKPAIAHASTLETAEALAKAGSDLNQLEGDVRANLLGLGEQENLTTNRQDYLAQKHRVYGTSNPQRCNVPFWYDMVRTNGSAWMARSQFDDTDACSDQAVWCYERYGKSITALRNGEFVEIAGEHEDSYDPDFCIYNEVFHHKGGGDFVIYQYPKEVFPPTDFHSATLVDQYIYVIGNLGYLEERQPGITPVYRLDTKSFEMERLETTGECPGWIYKHSADLENQSVIRIQGGEIFAEVGGKVDHCFNSFDFELSLDTLQWTKRKHIPKSGKNTFFAEEYKRFSNSEGELLSTKANDKWRLIKVISVHRLDLAEGQKIQFANEVVTVLFDDFIFVVAYSTSEPFDSFEQLEKAAAENSWSLDIPCTVCRTINFPETGRFFEFAEIVEEERESFEAWKELFEIGQAKIL